MKEIEGSLSEDEKSAIEAAKEDLKKALEGTNIEEIKDKTEKLTEQFHTISAKMYQQAQAQQQAQAGGCGPDCGCDGDCGTQSGPAGDNVVDADFEVVDEDK